KIPEARMLIPNKTLITTMLFSGQKRKITPNKITIHEIPISIHMIFLNKRSMSVNNLLVLLRKNLLKKSLSSVFVFFFERAFLSLYNLITPFSFTNILLNDSIISYFSLEFYFSLFNIFFSNYTRIIPS